VEERGEGRVYLEFLTQINDLVRGHGKSMQFWGDIILNHPELIPELPEGAIALAWGYEADHPYADQCKKFAEAGIPFYVCPGTSAWNTIIGRTDNAVGNLLNAAVNGSANGARGYLNTDWGDGGHWQQMPISYLGYAYGAAVSWAVEANRDADLPCLMDRYVFNDQAGVMGRLAYELGNVYLETGILTGNSNVFGRLLANPNLSMDQSPWTDLKVEGLQRAIQKLDALEAQLNQARMGHSDSQLVLDEFRNGIALARHACHLGIARLEAGRVEVPQLSSEARAVLARELEPTIAEFKRLWLIRNRPGGLQDSAGRFESLLASYKQ
jgi:hexosaminidase